MPFLNESRHLPAVLASLAEQSIDPSRLYLIGVDNGSTDGGDRYFERWRMENGVAGTLVRDEVRSIPRALNRGLTYASPEDIVVRLDAHTIYAPDYLATIDDAFARLPSDVWCVGGAPTPETSEGNYGRSLGVALYSNPLGLGPADFRKAQTQAPVEVSTVYLGAWRPGILGKLGGFDERWAANEDCELTERIRARGGRIMRVPVRAGRISTRGPLATIVQWSRYGYWRMQTFKHYPAAVRPRHVAVPVALLAAIGLLCSRYRAGLLPLYALYAFATIRSRRAGEAALVTAGTLLFFPLVHVGYGLGLIVGLLRTPASMRAREGSAPWGPKKV